MKILVLSALHIEHAPFNPPLESASSADVVVLAGDIYQGVYAVWWARLTFPDKPIVLVAGNHEFYRGHWGKALDAIREAAHVHDVHFLEDAAVMVGDAWFLGATLWTDFEYFGADLRDAAERAARSYLADYRLIDGCTPQASIDRQMASRAWLESDSLHQLQGAGKWW
ncbi:metallophosphoesterase [Acidovorax sp.]|uniref:metallophosphoesterase n=1 Tax=Acidovorax sp. TaxID=1872122 RepID=UPI00391EFBFD